LLISERQKLNTATAAVARNRFPLAEISTPATRSFHLHRIFQLSYTPPGQDNLFLSSKPNPLFVIRIPVSRILIPAFLLFIIVTSPAVSAYGRSVEDLVGAFSIEKTIKIGSSSQDFIAAGDDDPLSPPQSLASGPLADDQAPSLAGFAIEPQLVSSNSSQPINLTLHAIDDQAVWAAEARFSGPTGEEAVALFPAQNLTSGSVKDGIYSARMLLPANATGDWYLQSMTLVDREGNRRILGQSDLLQLGLPTQISVI
jgi:hypothetical protein